jgi:hypothetical protein
MSFYYPRIDPEELAMALDPIAPAFDKLRNLLIFGKRDALLPAYLVP